MKTPAIATSTVGTAPSTRWNSCWPSEIILAATTAEQTGASHGRRTRHILLERTDDSRCRGRKEVLRPDHRLELRRHAHTRRRHVLAGEDGRWTGRWHLGHQRRRI